MNKVFLIGNLGQDPEMKYFETGSVVAKFSMAINSYDSKNKEEKTDWISCEAWKKTAELIGEYCKKGSKIAIEGSLKTQNWEDSNGQKRTKTFVLVSRAEFLTTNKRTEETESKAETEFAQKQFATEEEIPF